MKTYNDIGDLYREQFADYAPQPPSSVWENVQSEIEKKPSRWGKLKKKLPISIGAIIAVSAIAYLFIAPETKTEELTTAKNTGGKTENKEVRYEEMSSENLPDVSNQKNVFASEQGNTSALQNDENIANSSNNSINENFMQQSSPQTVEQITNDKKNTTATTSNISAEQTNEQRPLEENKPKKKLAIISKDTSICENTAAQLYVRNAENIRWSTGETKNIITVYPSSDEQYSLTFSTENKDTTVYINVTVVHCLEVHIPNAFTPNGDGRNDVFLAKADMELKSFEMIIYSADGRQVVFSSKDINRGWDGTFRGQLQPHGLYYYKVRYVDNFGKNIEKPGELLLINQ